MARKIDPERRARYRKQCAYNALIAWRKFEWNSNRVAGVSVKDTDEVVTAKFVALYVSGDEVERKIAKARLKHIEDIPQGES